MQVVLHWMEFHVHSGSDSLQKSHSYWRDFCMPAQDAGGCQRSNPSHIFTNPYQPCTFSPNHLSLALYSPMYPTSQQLPVTTFRPILLNQILDHCIFCFDMTKIFLVDSSKYPQASTILMSSSSCCLISPKDPPAIAFLVYQGCKTSRWHTWISLRKASILILCVIMARGSLDIIID